ncbi:hypothetical protein ANCCEY_07343 [Ancylostoma ceylanicum]|uniref:Phlebovirus glycoprotein G2 fusion domain-containing protein n=1 Tax=Ancylostoma ceylanicum TaxID=53326 RepID=A0A0D6LNB0_9BILA|nr:hypothetical protein ANCCEY_07343 [Ancylostoma ceylanicum]
MTDNDGEEEQELRGPLTPDPTSDDEPQRREMHQDDSEHHLIVSSGCLFYRIYATPVNNEVYEIFNSPR